MASQLISDKWSQDELNHFRVTFHSDTLIDCGVKNDLWKLVELTDNTGKAWTTAYQMTEKGKKVMSAIDLKESGKGHEIILRGPYRNEITSMGDGSQPNTKKAAFRWTIDWDKASDDLKVCLPRFELSGTEVALFEVNGVDWRLVSLLRPEDAPAPQAPASPTSALDKLR